MRDLPNLFSRIRSRLLNAAQMAGLHLFGSLIVAALTAALVFFVWFPDPYRDLAGGAHLFWLIVSVDVVCGPLLTLALYDLAKTRMALTVDVILVGFIQLAALAYGIHALSYSRPLALVHEVDRFRVVTYADIAEADFVSAPPWVRPWGFSAPRVLGTRRALTIDEKFAGVEAWSQGVEPGQRPALWQDYPLSVPQVLERSRSLAELRALHPEEDETLNNALALVTSHPGETNNPALLRWLPLVSRRAMDWVVLIDPQTARIRGFVHLDGFEG